MSRILLTNHEEITVKILTKILKTAGYRIAASSNVEQAKKLIGSEEYNLMISGATADVDPDMSVVALAREKQKAMPIIILADSDEDLLAKVNEFKPFDCIEKPMKVDKLLTSVQKAIDYNDNALTENINLNLKLETSYTIENIVAESAAMKSVCDMVSRVSGTDVTIMLAGENGTGKIAIAEAIHKNSRRKEHQFITVRCSGSADDLRKELFGDAGGAGAIENAAGGTLFLREISGMPTDVQAEFVTAMKERSFTKPGASDSVEVDVRLVASTDKDIAALVEQGTFNEALYNMIKIIMIRIAPLRDRKQDIMPTVRLILQKIIGEGKMLPALDPDVIAEFENHSWPGNVTEMEGVLKQALQNSGGDKIDKASLPGW